MWSRWLVMVPIVFLLVLVAVPTAVQERPLAGSASSFSAPTPVAAALLNPSSCTNCVIGNVSIPLGPLGIGFDSVNGNLYVADGNTANVTVINGTTNTNFTSIQVGIALDDVPSAIAVDTTTNDIYVPDDTNNNVTVIDAATNKVIKSIVVKPDPFAALFDPENGYVYVGDEGVTTAWVSVIDGATLKTITNISIGNNVMELPQGLALDSSNGYLFAGNSLGTNVTVINTTTDTTIGQGTAGYNPQSGAYDSANGNVYFANAYGNNVSVLNGSTFSNVSSIITSTLDYGPSAVAYDAATGCIYAPTQGADSVSVIDGATEAAIVTIPVAGAPTNVAVDTTNGDVYVTYTNTAETDSNVTVIRPADCPASGSVLSSVSVAPLIGEIFLAGGTSAVTATPTCSPGPCGGTISYQWSLSNSNATLSSTTSNPTNVVAGTTSTTETVFVNATLGSFVVAGNQVSVAIVIGGSPSGLTSVSVGPVSPTILPNGTQIFTASPTCSPSPCGSGVTYLWSLSKSLGTLSSTSGVSVTFTAGSALGVVNVNVTASLSGKDAKASAVLTISSTGASPSPSGLFGLPGDDGILLIAVVVIIAVGALAGLMFMRRTKVSPPPPTSWTPPPPGSSPPPPPPPPPP